MNMHILLSCTCNACCNHKCARREAFAMLCFGLTACLLACLPLMDINRETLTFINCYHKNNILVNNFPRYTHRLGVAQCWTCSQAAAGIFTFST